jgi:MoaA/NifB/PqqE/SkfB family radical SAM enzyme
MYACSPQWKANWLSEEDAKIILSQLAGKIQPDSSETNAIGINCGIHFTGGEPFLNFDLLLNIVKIGHEFNIPSMFVETNCFWCDDDHITEERLTLLKNAGLHGILISVNPFILEQVPFEKTKRAIRISSGVFKNNVIVYQQFFYHLFDRFNIKEKLSFEEYLRMAKDSLNYIELLPMGRAVYELGFLYEKYPAKEFFGISCHEELTRKWHIHIDNYGNYITGYCGGISLGNARNLNSLLSGIDLDDRPILAALASELKNLYRIGVEKYNYKERAEGYVSKCHLCVDIRHHIVQQIDAFIELQPREFYSNLKII